MSKYTQISILTRKRRDGVLFKYSRWYEGLQLYEKITSSQMLPCETCVVLKKISFKENCWSTASGF